MVNINGTKLLTPMETEEIRGYSLSISTLKRVESVFNQHGFVLLKELSCKTIDDFALLKAKLISKSEDYLTIVNPYRKVRVNGNVNNTLYRSAAISSKWNIPLHNEIGYSSNFPERILFFCEQKAESGGEISICDIRNIFKHLPVQLVDKVRKHGVCYTRRLPKKSHLFYQGWSEIFNTDNPDIVRDSLKYGNFVEKDWNINFDGDVMILDYITSGLRYHPRTGEEIWFNQIPLFHNTGFEYVLKLALEKNVCEKDILDVKRFYPTNCTLGNGIDFSRNEIESIWYAYMAETKVLEWRKGDIILLDNLLFAHGFKSFSGEQKILIAMGN